HSLHDALPISPPEGRTIRQAMAYIMRVGGDLLSYHHLPVDQPPAEGQEKYNKQLCQLAYIITNVHMFFPRSDTNLCDTCSCMYISSAKVYHSSQRLTSEEIHKPSRFCLTRSKLCSILRELKRSDAGWSSG